MEKLLQPDCQISGEIFYITDGNPTSVEFLTNPLKKFIMNKYNTPHKKGTTSQIHVPKKLAVIYALILSHLSKWGGKSFRMPTWGFTYMELQKVNITISK